MKPMKILKQIMKETFIKITLALLLVAGCQSGYAQCDTTVLLESSKTNYLDGKGNVYRTKDEATTITISKTAVVISYGNNDHQMSGDITSATCDWKTPFKEGKMIVKAGLENSEGIKQQGTLTITGVAGKITLIYEAKERPGIQIQLVVDKFEEKKRKP
ncbi:MAG: hypothetical protein INR73_19805 [Williamsia sp.]|nr:hypothetical protein [Williamsia sp.]